MNSLADWIEGQFTAATLAQLAALAAAALAAWLVYLITRRWYVTRSEAGIRLGGVVLVAGVSGVVNLPCVSTWAVLGQQIRRWLNSNLRLRVFNWTMAALLVLSLAPVLQL